MAQQLMSFTQRMMEKVIETHSTRTDHDDYCCTVASEYAVRLGTEAPAVPAQQTVSDTFRKDPLPESGTTTKPPAQRKPKADPDKMASDRQLDYILSLGRRVAINLIAPAHRTMLQTVRNGQGLKAVEAMELIEAMKAQTDERPREATDRQIRYLHSLVKTREWNGEIDFENLTSVKASGLINDLRKMPKKASADKDAEEDRPARGHIPDIGAYLVGDTYYRVVGPRVAGGAPYAYRWFTEADKWIYDGQKHFRLLIDDKKVTAEQATFFGKTYSNCIVLGCKLTNEHSREMGYGETCAENMGWPY